MQASPRSEAIDYGESLPSAPDNPFADSPATSGPPSRLSLQDSVQFEQPSGVRFEDASQAVQLRSPSRSLPERVSFESVTQPIERQASRVSYESQASAPSEPAARQDRPVAYEESRTPAQSRAQPAVHQGSLPKGDSASQPINGSGSVTGLGLPPVPHSPLTFSSLPPAALGQSLLSPFAAPSILVSSSATQQHAIRDLKIRAMVSTSFVSQPQTR